MKRMENIEAARRPVRTAEALLLALAGLFAGVMWCRGTEAGGPQQAGAGDGDSVERVVSLLKEMPSSWPDSEFEAAARQIAAYPSDAIRAGMDRYLKWSRTTLGPDVYFAGQKLYALNKYLFDLPETVRLDSPMVKFDYLNWFTGHISGDGRKDSDLVWIRWPWAEQEDGTWRLLPGPGSSSGPPYSWPLEAFDYYRRTLPRRDVGRKRSGPATRPAERPVRREVDAIVSLLEEMPNWTKPNMADANKRAKMEDTARRIAGYPTEAIRAAMERYWKEGTAAAGDEASRAGLGLYVLNKYLFDFPETVALDSATRRHDAPWFGGWTSGWFWTKQGSKWVRVYSKLMPNWAWIRWPWAEQEDGTWRLWATPPDSTEQAYRPLEAFDYYRKTYPRRDVARRRDRSRVLPALIETLAEESPRACYRAAKALKSIGKPSVLPVVEFLEKVENDERADPGLRALNEMGMELVADVLKRGETVDPGLVELLKSRARTVRIWAAQTLGRMGSCAKSAIPALKETLKDGDPKVRDAASEALQRIRDAPQPSTEKRDSAR